MEGLEKIMSSFLVMIPPAICLGYASYYQYKQKREIIKLIKLRGEKKLKLDY